jgi:deoxyribose-phosphate aldolase
MAAMRVVLASDHGGFPLKEALVKYLRERGFDVIDAGTSSTEACDYPVFAKKAAEIVARGEAARGIVIDGAGIGSGMVANKVAGVRSAMAFDAATARNSREHNDANVLTLGSSWLDEAKAREIVDVFLSTDCTVDRHRRRVAMIDALDSNRPGGTQGRTSMSSSGGADHSALVAQITEILAKNPGLLGGGPDHGGGAPRIGACPTCSGCGQCASKRPGEVRSLVDAAGGTRSRISATLGVGEVPKDLAPLIDHTLLKADATYAEIDKLCDEAAQYGFASVCVNPLHVARCAKKLAGKSPLVCTVIGFPLGATPKEIKALEARRAIRDGAREVDMVIAIGALKSGDNAYVEADIRAVAEAAHDGGAILKVIIETALLTDEEKTTACRLALKARADFVKTSTGFAAGGATAADVRRMADAVEHKIGVKASGGIRSAADAATMVAAGATRIGASVGVKIAREQKGLPVEKSAGKGY